MRHFPGSDPRPSAGVPLRASRRRFLVTALLLLFVPGGALAQTLSIAETENLVRMRHYEGVPEESLDRIGAEGCERLVEMLADPTERKSHAEVLLGIGHCRPEGGLEAIAAWADRPRDGEIDRATFRAWQALPFALAALAEEDPRAVARLTARLENDEAPRWTFRHHRGDRLKKLRKRAAADCLADTDHPDADAALDRAARAARDGDMRAHIERARDRYLERRAERRGDRREVGRRGMTR